MSHPLINETVSKVLTVMILSHGSMIIFIQRHAHVLKRTLHHGFRTTRILTRIVSQEANTHHNRLIVVKKHRDLESLDSETGIFLHKNG